ncbi:RNA-guided endonuclease InsQ/TnpB family protein [Trichothermofontia sp.]
MGIESYVATSNGELIPNPRFLVSGQRKLRSRQRRLKRMRQGSRNWRKQQQRVARHHEYLSNARKDFQYKLAHHLCDQAGIIFAEDLNLKALAKEMLGKHCLDAGWGDFLSILSHVCWQRGVYFAKGEAKGTSQTCPSCGGGVGKKNLAERTHYCPACGYTANRDVAAAQVVRQRGIAAVGHIVKLLGEGNV